jgi:hypothetical protein
LLGASGGGRWCWDTLVDLYLSLLVQTEMVPKDLQWLGVLMNREGYHGGVSLGPCYH